MSLHPEDVQKLQWLYDVVRGIDGDNIRWSGNSLYIGSGGVGGDTPGTDWKPRQFRVVSEENDYLVCVPYNSVTEEAGTREYKVAKAPDHRGDTVRRGVYPGYVPEETVIWAAPFRVNGAQDDADEAILLMEVNPDGRNAAWFMAEITSSSSSSEDHTFIEVGPGLTQLTDGRTATNAKALNGRKGVPTTTIVFVLEVKTGTAGEEPEYYFVIPDGLTDNPKDLVDTGASADTATWDIEADSEPVNYQPARVLDDIDTSGEFYFYSRDIIADASGMITNVSAETRTALPGNGYYETRASNVLVDQIPHNGVLDFDDSATTSTDEYPVEWELDGGLDADAVEAGNDGLRTRIRGKVDLSGLDVPSVGGMEVFDVEVEVTDAASTGITVLDSDNYSGRTLFFASARQENTTRATWDAYTLGSSAGLRYVGESVASDIVLDNSANFRLFIDVSDSYQLKLEVLTAPTSTNSHFFRFSFQKFERKTASDVTINS